MLIPSSEANTVIGGIDTHQDQHWAAIVDQTVDQTGRVLGTQAFLDDRNRVSRHAQVFDSKCKVSRVFAEPLDQQIDVAGESPERPERSGVGLTNGQPGPRSHGGEHTLTPQVRRYRRQPTAVDGRMIAAAWRLVSAGQRSSSVRLAGAGLHREVNEVV